MQPIHVVGWTLNYEMFFYALFALAIALPRRVAVGVLIAILVGMVIIGRASSPSMAALTFWCQPIILNFVLGLGIGLAYKEGVRLPRPVALAMIGMAAFLLCRQIGQGFPSAWNRIPAYGCPAALLLAGATLGRFGPPPERLRLIALLGEASYALYLLHTLVLWACRMLAIRLGFPVADAPWAYAGGVMLAAVAASVVAHRFFDQPITEWLRRRFVPAAAESSSHGGASGAISAK